MDKRLCGLNLKEFYWSINALLAYNKLISLNVNWYYYNINAQKVFLSFKNNLPILFTNTGLMLYNFLQSYKKAKKTFKLPKKPLFCKLN